MKTFLTLVLAAASSAAAAQTPAINPMPDGSRDMFVGVGVGVGPRYDGSDDTRVRALPLLQIEWSNGVFISGASAGMHLSSNPALEYGPLLGIKMRRSEAGEGLGVIGTTASLSPTVAAAIERQKRDGNGLDGMDPVPTRLQGGGFLNYYLSPTLRLANSVLAGAGRERDGAVWNVDLQQMAGPVSGRHAVSLSAGLTFANRSYNESAFGVSLPESFRSGNEIYLPGGGLNDIHAAVRWNWSLSPSWLLTTNARVVRLTGDAKHSPLVRRPSNFSVTTGLAYRF